MNSSVYIFGNMSSGYTQYPDDYSKAIFTTFYKYSKATTQLTLHREGNLMYYGYIRKLEQNRYVGFCVVLNGLMLVKVDGLFNLFENVISNLVEKGSLICFNISGNIEPCVKMLYLSQEEIFLITEALKAGFNKMEGSSKKIPNVDFSVGKDSKQAYSIEDDYNEIVKSSYTNGFTLIYKSKDYNTAQLNSYQAILLKLNNENASLKKENDKLKAEKNKILQQKNRFRFVIILFVVAIVLGVGSYTLYESLGKAQIALKDAKGEIKKKNDSIQVGNAYISSLKEQQETLQNSLQVVSNQLKEAQDNLKRSPEIKKVAIPKASIKIYNVDYDYDTRTCSFHYKSNVEKKNMLITIYVHDDEGDSYSQSFVFGAHTKGAYKIQLKRKRNFTHGNRYVFDVKGEDGSLLVSTPILMY